MANFIYDKARERFLNGEISWTNDDIRAMLIKEGLYTPNATQHSTLQDVPESAQLAVSGTLENKGSVNGIASALPTLFSSVPAGTATSVILFKNGPSRSQCFLITHIDVYVQPIEAEDVTIQWNTTGNKIFKL